MKKRPAPRDAPNRTRFIGGLFQVRMEPRPRRTNYAPELRERAVRKASIRPLTIKVGHAEAARIGEQLCAETLARIHWASPEEERAAFAYLISTKTRRTALWTA